MSIITAGIASWLTVQLSLQRFYREKHWEKRFQAYTEVLDALHALNRAVLEQRVADANPGSPYNVTADRLILPMTAIHRAIDLEGFLISPAMVALLREFANAMGETSRKRSQAEVVAASAAVLGKTLPQACAIAAKDLGLRRIDAKRTT